MTGPVAALPMYDWPEVRGATDAFWAALRDALRGRGIAAPDALSRDRPYGAAWTDPGLVLGQTCSLPYRTRLHGAVTLIGAIDFALAGCPPGFYRSALVAAADDPREGVGAYLGARFAFNATDSQSGWGALTEALGPLDPAQGLETGAHRASIAAVAEGRAEIAAIDAVSWRLAEAWEPAAVRVRVVGLTRPTPGLPLITAAGRDPAPFAAAVEAAIAALDPVPRAALGLRGFVPLVPEDYLHTA